MNAEAKNLRAIYEAKRVHDAECPWQGEGKRVLMHPFDVERMGWEDGDQIAGLTLFADQKVTTGMLKVECDNEPDGHAPEQRAEIVDVVSKDRELEPVA